MRLRNIKGADERILADPYTIQTDGTDGADFKGRWNREYFHNDHPIHIEIGMGKGQFITTLAQQNPNINYIGIEKYSSVLIRAIDKREELALDNLLRQKYIQESEQVGYNGKIVDVLIVDWDRVQKDGIWSKN